MTKKSTNPKTKFKLSTYVVRDYKYTYNYGSMTIHANGETLSIDLPEHQVEEIERFLSRNEEFFNQES